MVNIYFFQYHTPDPNTVESLRKQREMAERASLEIARMLLDAGADAARDDARNGMTHVTRVLAHVSGIDSVGAGSC